MIKSFMPQVKLELLLLSSVQILRTGELVSKAPSVKDCPKSRLKITLNCCAGRKPTGADSDRAGT